MSEEVEAALDENMPPLDEADEVVEATDEEVTDEVNDTTAVSDTEAVGEEEDKQQKALNKLAFENRERKRNEKALQEENEALKAKLTPARQEVTAKPTLEQFDFDDDAYQEALVDYRLDLRLAEQNRQQEIDRDAERQQTTQKSFNEKVTVAKAKMPDYEDVVGNLAALQIPQDTLDIILEAENGPELAYHLGNNYDLADKISGLTPVQAALQLGIISAQLSSTAKPVIKTSAAPEPIKPITASGSLSKSYDEMSMDEIMAL